MQCLFTSECDCIGVDLLIKSQSSYFKNASKYEADMMEQQAVDLVGISCQISWGYNTFHIGFID